MACILFAAAGAVIMNEFQLTTAAGPYLGTRVQLRGPLDLARPMPGLGPI